MRDERSYFVQEERDSEPANEFRRSQYPAKCANSCCCFAHCTINAHSEQFSLSIEFSSGSRENIFVVRTLSTSTMSKKRRGKQ